VLLVGIQSHGQGLETTLSQIAHEELGIDPAKISVRHGDTGLSPFGMGTIASRSIVMAGGAVARTTRLLREKILKVGAHLLQCDVADVRCEGGKVIGKGGEVGIDEVARVAHLRMEALPQGVEPLLSVTSTYQPGIDTGVYSYATHAAVVAVDPATGMIELRLAVAEDCGTDQSDDAEARRGGAGRHRAHEIPRRAGQPLAGASPIISCRCGRIARHGDRAHAHNADANQYGSAWRGGAIAPPPRPMPYAIEPARRGGQRRC
jgi:carbon-monoxide dehydrogenase large subunit